MKIPRYIEPSKNEIDQLNRNDFRISIIGYGND